jgi:hypothetical protein
MKIVEKIENQDFPIEWANLDSLSDSKGYRVEIYLIRNDNLLEDLISMFNTLFRTIKKSIKLYDSSWWDYCLDTWDPNNDKYDYELEGKSDETRDYLIMLKASSVEVGYSGVCRCIDWNVFLRVSLTCIVTHKAPYGHIFYDEENDFFFYFHHSGSIGFYYKERNEIIEKILSISKDEYDVR